MPAKKKPTKKPAFAPWSATEPLAPGSTREARALIKSFEGKSGFSQRAPGGLLVFTAAWCGPCQGMKPAFKNLAKEGVPVVYVDIDAVPKVAEEYGIQSIPAIWKLEHGKKPAELVVGAVPEKVLRNLLGG